MTPPRRAGARGVHHALGNALAVEVLQLLDQVDILQQDRPARAGGDRVLAISYRDAAGGCQALRRVTPSSVQA
jgi:hypothetical protein